MSKDTGKTSASVSMDSFIKAYLEHASNESTSSQLAAHLGISTQALYNMKSTINKKLADAGYAKLPDLKSSATGRKPALNGHQIHALITRFSQKD
jgi:hypothetical protein